MLDANVPPHTMRKSRLANAAIAVPGAQARSPSTSASVASSGCGSWVSSRTTSSDQDAGVEDPGGVEGVLRGRQGERERIRPLPVVPVAGGAPPPAGGGGRP